MAKWHQIQNNFLQGELSPEFAAQAGQDTTAAGLKTAQNAMLLRSGAIVKSPGTVFVSELGTVADHGKARIWPYIDKDTNARLLATFTDGKVFVTDKLNGAAIGSAFGWDTAELASEPVVDNADIVWKSQANPAKTTYRFYEPSECYTLPGYDKYPTDLSRPTNPIYASGGGYGKHRLEIPAAGDYASRAEVYATHVVPELYKRGFSDATDGYFSTLPLTPPPSEASSDPAVALQYRVTGDSSDEGSGFYTDVNGYDSTTDGVDNVPRIRQAVTLATDATRLNLRLRLAADNENMQTGFKVFNPGTQTTTYYPRDDNNGLDDAALRAERQRWYEKSGLRIRVTTGGYAGTVLVDETVMNPTSITLVHNPLDLENFFREYDVSAAGLSAGDTIYLHIGLVATDVQATFDSSPASDTRSMRYIQVIHSWDMIATGGGEAFNIGEAVTPYTADQAEELHFLQSPFNEKELTAWHPQVEPYRLYFGGGPPEVWTFEPYAISPQPPQWGADNYPGVATAYQGRLIVTGAPFNPETVWASRSGDWKDFDTSVTVTPATPIEFTPTERGENTWLTGFQRPLFGNTINEYSIDAQSGLLQATDVAVNQRTTYGALRMPQKTTFGRSVALPTAGNRAVRLLQYDDRAGGFIGMDASTHADHIFQSGIRRVFFTRDPQETLWCVLEDGRVACMNMEPELAQPGWTWMDFSGGRVLDAAPVITTEGRTNLAMLVARERSDGIEYVTLEAVADLRARENWRYLNARVTRVKSPGVDVVPGFDHLEGKPVAVFVDDVYLNTQVVSSGTVLVDTVEGVNVTAGLAYNFKAETLPVGSMDFRVVGMAGKKRFATVGARVLDSGPPLINGMRPQGARTPQMSMDLPPEYVGVFDYETTDRGWDSAKTVTVEEPEPFAVTLLGIYGKLATNEV